MQTKRVRAAISQNKIIVAGIIQTKWVRAGITQNKIVRNGIIQTKGGRTGITQNKSGRAGKTQNKIVIAGIIQTKGGRAGITQNKTVRARIIQNKRVRTEIIQNQKIRAGITQNKWVRAGTTQIKQHERTQNKRAQLHVNNLKECINPNSWCILVSILYLQIVLSYILTESLVKLLKKKIPLDMKIKSAYMWMVRNQAITFYSFIRYLLLIK